MIPTAIIAFTLAAGVFVAAYVIEGYGARPATPIIAAATALGGPVVLVGGWMTGHIGSMADFIMLVAILVAGAAGSYLSSRRKTASFVTAVAQRQRQGQTAEQSHPPEPATGPVSDGESSSPAR